MDVRQVHKGFQSLVRGPGAPRAVHAVNDVSFTLAAGEVVALVGQSGSGKPPFHGILGLEEITEGSISIEGLLGINDGQGGGSIA